MYSSVMNFAATSLMLLYVLLPLGGIVITRVCLLVG